MPKLTRRGLFAVGGAGAAGLAVAGCGDEDDPRQPAQDEELLNAAATAEADLGAVYDGMAEGTKATPELTQLQEQSAERRDELNKLGAAKAEATAASGATMADVSAAADAAIAAYREGVRLFSETELRATAIQFLTQVSSEQALARGESNEDPSPTPFVTGLEEKPYVASDEDDTTTSTTSTTSSSTSTTTETGE